MIIYQAPQLSYSPRPFYLYNNLFSKLECERIIKAATPYRKREYEPDYLMRFAERPATGYIEALKKNEWIYDRISIDALVSANKHYQMQVVGFTDELRLKVYQQGESFPWHQDMGFRDKQDNSKLSVVIMLSDSSSYKGGNLQLLNYKTPILQQGAAIVYPSLLAHRVTKILSGKRVTLAGWWE